jgi:beta-galactosidase
MEFTQGRATRWVDGLIAEGADVLAEYDHPHFGRFPAVTTQEHGQGRITTVGTVPDETLARDLLRWLVPEPHPGWAELPTSVTLSSAATRDGGRLHVVHNWGWEPASVTAPQPLVDLLHPESEPSAVVELGAWDVRVLTEPATGD